MLADNLLGEAQASKIKLRYADMLRNFDCVTFDELEDGNEDNVWKFSSGVTPYKDFDDTTNIPIPITNSVIRQIADTAVTSLDLPTWFNLSVSDRRVMLLSQDPMPRSEWYDDCRDAVCSSPFGLHSKSWREKSNGGGRMWGLVQNMISNNIGVYLTDVRKFYFRTADNNRKYIAPTDTIKGIYSSLLSKELQIIKPDAIVSFGNQASNTLSELFSCELEIKTINMPHFSGQAQGKIKDYFNISPNCKFTVSEQVEAYTRLILNTIYNND